MLVIAAVGLRGGNLFVIVAGCASQKCILLDISIAQPAPEGQNCQLENPFYEDGFQNIKRMLAFVIWNGLYLKVNSAPLLIHHAFSVERSREHIQMTGKNIVLIPYNIIQQAVWIDSTIYLVIRNQTQFLVALIAI